MSRDLPLTGVTSTATGEARNCEADDDDDDDEDDDDDDAAGDDLCANAASGDSVNELDDDNVKDVGETKVEVSALRSRSARSWAVTKRRGAAGAPSAAARRASSWAIRCFMVSSCA